MNFDKPSGNKLTKEELVAEARARRGLDAAGQARREQTVQESLQRREQGRADAVAEARARRGLPPKPESKSSGMDRTPEQQALEKEASGIISEEMVKNPQIRELGIEIKTGDLKYKFREYEEKLKFLEAFYRTRSAPGNEERANKYRELSMKIKNELEK